MHVWSFVDGDWREGVAKNAAFRWYQVDSPDAERMANLAERFGFHPLSIEDCLSPELHTPKVDEFDSHLFLVFVAIIQDGSENPVPDELDAFLGADYLVTYSDRPLPEVDRVHEAIRSGIHLRPGPDGLLYEIVDRVVDGMLPEVDLLAKRLDAIEHRVISRPANAADSRDIVATRGAAGDIRRLLVPQLTLMQRLSRGEFELVCEANRIYFRDVYDHLVRVDLGLDGVRDDAEMVLNTYLSAVNNRLSEVMKVMAIVTALALPSTVISGIFGTNFDNVPGLHSNWGFALMMAAMSALGLSMAYYFRRRGWF